MLTLRFLGAAGCVTGSRHLLDVDGRRILVDCGLFQGQKELRLRNWDPFPVDPQSIQAVVVTHAHIDHTGYLPRLAARGFRGPIYATPTTTDLCGILLPDSARLQEEEAAYANKKGYSKHAPALPLYTEKQAAAALSLFQAAPYGRTVDLGGGLSFAYSDAGHILGSGLVTVTLQAGQAHKTIVFSGDLGRFNHPILNDPTMIAGADVVVVESTYGDRIHGDSNPEDDLAAAIQTVVRSGGVLVMPVFAVERTEQILFYLNRLVESKAIPPIPVYLDSPMAVSVIGIYERHKTDMDAEAQALERQGRGLQDYPHLHLSSTVEESRAINAVKGPAIILSPSGMATGGRVLHHLAQRLPDPKNAVLLVGYQAAGTRGRRLQEGAATLRIFGQDVPVRAAIKFIGGFSGHADYNEALRWLGGFTAPRPSQAYIVHGEPAAAQSLQAKIQETLHWPAHVAAYLETVTLAE